jgi:glucose-1-phosphate thymidylyltransferase
MQAVVLAAGEGQRLRPFTANKPKVMIKVANKPIIEYVIEALKNAGIQDIVVVVGYRMSRVMDYLGNGEKLGVRIEYAVQKQQLGAAHALKQAEEFVKSEEFITVAGDNIFDSKTIEKLDEPWTIAYKKSDEPTKYGVILMENDVVKKIVEKPRSAIGNLVNVGIYRFTREIFSHIGEERDMIAVLNNMIASGCRFKCVEAEMWMDIVYPWDILRVNDLAMDFSGKRIAGRVEKAQIYGDVVIGRGSIIEPGTVVKGPVVIGEDCEIGANTVIRASTSIGDNCTIGAFSYIENSVIGDNVVIAPGSFIVDSVIDRGCRIGARFTAMSGRAEMRIMEFSEIERSEMEEKTYEVKAGVFMGERCEVENGVIAEPGTVVGNDVKIAAMKLIRGTIPDFSIIL